MMSVVLLVLILFSSTIVCFDFDVKLGEEEREEIAIGMSLVQ